MLLLLIVGLGLLEMTGGAGAAARQSNGVSSAPGSQPAGPSYAAAPRGRPAALRGEESATENRAASAPASDNSAELAIAPIKKAYVQREDGSLRAKDAPPPLFRTSTIVGLRAAVAPAIQHCIDEGLARSPEQRELDSHPSVSIVYTASAAAGSVAVMNAEVTINGTQDDTLVRCVEAAYQGIKIRAPSDQPDGEGKVIAAFDYK